MLPHLSVNDTRYVPPVDQLRQQARFLRDHCNVKLSHAYEMVAYFYRLSSWVDLIGYANSNTVMENQRSVAKMREELQIYRNSLSCTDLLRVAQLEASQGTLTEAVEKDRIKTLNDLDIVQFYNSLYNQEYWSEPVPVSLYDVLDATDRCLVLLAKRTALRGRVKKVNPHISFPWFGVKMYGYLYVNGSTLNYECRELDSFLWPSEKQYKKVFSRPWFVAYVSGFIRTQLRSLCISGFSGKASFARVNDIDLVLGQTIQPYLDGDEYLNDDEVIRTSINKIVEKLLSMGGVRDTKKENITFTFGNGEVY
ncbi:hypothetical protein SOASR030_14270 [Leminorella grimontii]|uniref:Uncharacterized protein n=1 Tax=Leminorella grimontii TaxID=82981 RepID=A0AAV5N036_9GAMM|nr:hypothetical protein [Leminorella grimontii]KFC97332.1 hypothetical protein GLGR_0266 [Leminorella grimontii ATCC 33999 = DSM 5078]GKX55315.1 hypothetical protein SOASR030_14270 [Leminorella grimontii]VFS56600.1 Uncharacterised protein [Leminorella grimontii]